LKNVRWGIIGCGDVTEKKSGPGFQKAQNSELAAVMRRSADKAQDYARRHNVHVWYTDADKLINDPGVDAVYIATPPDTHKYYTLKVAAAGKPAYVEKPMARNFTECQDMIAACKSKNLPLFVAYYRRSLPKFLRVKEMLDDGIIGDVRSVTVTLFHPAQVEDYLENILPWRLVPEIAGGGLFFDLASHIFDILDFYFGPIASAKGFAGNQMGSYTAEDIVSASFAFENGILGSGIWCFSTNTHTDIIEITGERGKITIPAFAADPIILLTPDISESIIIDHPEHIQQPHIQSIVDELNGNGHCPSHGESAARTSRVMDWIIADWRQKEGIDFD